MYTFFIEKIGINAMTEESDVIKALYGYFEEIDVEGALEENPEYTLSDYMQEYNPIPNLSDKDFRMAEKLLELLVVHKFEIETYYHGGADVRPMTIRCPQFSDRLDALIKENKTDDYCFEYVYSSKYLNELSKIVSEFEDFMNNIMDDEMRDELLPYCGMIGVEVST